MASRTTVHTEADNRRRVDAGRAERYRVQRILWEHSAVERIRQCGGHAITPDGMAGIKHTVTSDGTRQAGFSGLHTCGSVWSCPSCNAKIAARRADELSQAVTRWEALGGRVLLLTLTVRHSRRDRLTDVWDAVSKGWARVTSGKAWEADQDRHGSDIQTVDLELVERPDDPQRIEAERLLTVELGAEPTRPDLRNVAYEPVERTRRRIHWVRAVEVTHGVNGWHVHVHALLFLRGDVDADRLSRSMFDRWSRGVQSAGMLAPSTRHGVDARWVDAVQAGASYLAKSTYSHAERAGWETAGGAMKNARGGNRAPFQVLRDFVATGDLDDLDTWHEWERGSRGRRQITWSRWFKNWLGIGEESDDEIAADDDLDGEVIAKVSADEWKSVRHRKADLLRAAEMLPIGTLRANPVTRWLTIMDLHAPPLTCENSQERPGVP